MYRGSRPKIFPVIIIIIVVALVIAAIVTIGRMVFSGNSSSNDAVDTASMQQSLLNESSDRAVRWTVRGPIIADEKFRSYQITVSPSERTYTVYSGYLDTVLRTKSYGNNADAYEQFIYALDKTGVSSARTVKDEDLRGVCATNGLLYQFETIASSTPDYSVWSSTCKNSPGTMTADSQKLQALFVNQITDFAPLFDDIY